MPPVVRYTLLRLGLFVVALEVFVLIGVRDVLLAALLAAMVSALISYPLLRRQREAMSVGLARRLERRRQHAVQRQAREDAADEAYRAEHGAPAPRGRHDED